VPGRVAYGDIIEGVTVQEEVDEQTGYTEVIIDHHDENVSRAFQSETKIM